MGACAGLAMRLVFSAWRATTDITNSVIASEAKQTRAARANLSLALDCFVASLSQ